MFRGILQVWRLKLPEAIRMQHVALRAHINNYKSDPVSRQLRAVEFFVRISLGIHGYARCFCRRHRNSRSGRRYTQVNINHIVVLFLFQGSRYCNYSTLQLLLLKSTLFVHPQCWPWIRHAVHRDCLEGLRCDMPFDCSDSAREESTWAKQRLQLGRALVLHEGSYRWSFIS